MSPFRQPYALGSITALPRAAIPAPAIWCAIFCAAIRNPLKTTPNGYAALSPKGWHLEFRMKSPRRSSTISLPDAEQGVAEVEFSNAAEADLVEIDEFSVARFGEEVADIYMHGFDEAFALLGDFPLAAQLRPELGDDIRCLVHRQHRIFCSVSGDKVLILRIAHHARDATRALKGGVPG